jgi:hypothetical protein
LFNHLVPLQSEVDRLKTILKTDAEMETDKDTPDEPVTTNGILPEPETTPGVDEEVTPALLRLRILHLEKLIRFLEKEFAPVRQELDALLLSGDIKFDLLWCLLRRGSAVTFKDHQSGLPMAGEVPHL